MQADRTIASHWQRHSCRQMGHRLAQKKHGLEGRPIQLWLYIASRWFLFRCLLRVSTILWCWSMDAAGGRGEIHGICYVLGQEWCSDHRELLNRPLSRGGNSWSVALGPHFQLSGHSIVIFLPSFAEDGSRISWSGCYEWGGGQVGYAFVFVPGLELADVEKPSRFSLARQRGAGLVTYRLRARGSRALGERRYLRIYIRMGCCLVRSCSMSGLVWGYELGAQSPHQQSMYTCWEVTLIKSSSHTFESGRSTLVPYDCDFLRV